MSDQKLKTDYTEIFTAELGAIDKLEETPKAVKNVAVSALDSALAAEIKHTTRIALENAKKMLENIGDGSLKKNFKVIYSQMCILAVSSLEAILKQYFENAMSNIGNINKANKKLDELKVSLLDLVENDLKFSGQLGRLVLEKDKPSFQDLKSIKAVFKDYLSKDIQLKPGDEKTICFYLEARHVLVHKGGKVDAKFIRATESFGANIKSYKIRDTVSIDENDWAEIKRSLIELVKQVTLRSK